MSRYFTILFLFSCVVSLAQHTSLPLPNTESPGTPQTKNENIVYKIIEGENHSFGYDILSDNHLLVHQPSIPGLPGKNGFKQKADAEKVAQLVITKIKQGEFPPTITQTEMRNLDIRIDEH